MSYIVAGACHCKNLSFEITTRTPPEEIRPRACDCSFCRSHGAQNWSDAAGAAIIHIANQDQLQHYRFALRTADFYICRVCGCYLGAILADDDGTWSTLNLRLSGLALNAEIACYGAEDTVARVSRRKRVWTPTAIITGA